MAFRVETTPEAERDILNILHWLIAQDAGPDGLRWFQSLERAISSLSEMPQRCSLAPENESFSIEVRQLLYGPEAPCVPDIVHDRIPSCLHSPRLARPSPPCRRN
jgi:plasmid stabilization system protein ParE